MKKEQERVLKYAGNAKGNCPACDHRMWYEPQTASMPPRFKCVCGYSIFNFTGMVQPDFATLSTMTR